MDKHGQEQGTRTLSMLAVCHELYFNAKINKLQDLLCHNVQQHAATALTVPAFDWRGLQKRSGPRIRAELSPNMYGRRLTLTTGWRSRAMLWQHLVVTLLLTPGMPTLLLHEPQEKPSSVVCCAILR